jgi:hypothetical protein
MRLLKKGKLGDVFFRLEECPSKVILTIGNKSAEEVGQPYAQIFFSSKEEFNKFVSLLDENNKDDD